MFEKSNSLIQLIVNPYKQEDIDKMFTKPVALPRHILPQERALLTTKELIGKHIVLEGSVCGLVILRSTLARIGLLSPPTVADPGFHGQLTMEVFNGSKHAITMHAGMAVWSLIRVPTIGEPMYTGRYQGQRGIQTPRALTPENVTDEEGGVDDQVTS
tara:strand:+ start:7339 stop:7812 length:474 start_codon:yes stop_codon:yes gene_type:complete